jgi:asparagine synthase (glutamine-hydrolysing)
MLELLVVLPPAGMSPSRGTPRLQTAAARLGATSLDARALGPALVGLARRVGTATTVGGWWCRGAPVTETSAGPAADTVVVAVDADVLAAVAAHPRPHELGAEAGHVRLSLDGGSIPLYWAEYDGWLLASTSLGALVPLGLPFAWDDTGVLEYLALLHPLGTRTVLARACALPAGAVLRRPIDRPATVTAAPLFSPRADEARPDDEVVDAFRRSWADAMARVVERYADRRVAVGLSGGLDSRVIAHGLTLAGAAPLAYTYGDESHREMAVARALAHRLGLPHLALPVTNEVVLADVARCAGRLDGAHSPAQMYEAWFSPRLHDVADVLLSGLGAGVSWGNDKALGLPADRLPDALTARALGGLGPVRRWLAPGIAETAEHNIRADVVAGLQAWPQDRTDLAVFWNMDNRQRRWGLMLPVSTGRDGLVVDSPFLDSAVLRLTAALTPEQRRYGGLYLRVHREAVSPVADIPRTEDGNAPTVLSHVYWAGDESLAAQLGGLARRHPLAAARRSALEARHRVATAATRRGLAGWAERELAAGDVFDPRLLARMPTYRARLRELVAAGLLGLPPAVDAASLDRSSAELAAGDVSAGDDLLAMARLATLGVWAQAWSGPDRPG